MQCVNLSKLIAYKSGNLNQIKKGKIENHLQSCPKCSKKVKAYENLRTFIRSNISIQQKQETQDCYDDSQILTYIESPTSTKSKKEVQLHLGECEYCLDRLVSLDSLLHELKAEGLIEVNLGLPERIKQTFTSITGSAGEKVRILWDVLVSPKPVYRWAGFALTVLIIGFIIYQPQSKIQSPLITRESTAELQIQLQAPENQSDVEGQQLKFSWTKVENISTYNFLLLDSNGDIIWEIKTKKNDVTLPKEIKLQSAMTYFWQVEGNYEFGRSTLSDMEYFTFKAE